MHAHWPAVWAVLVFGEETRRHIYTILVQTHNARTPYTYAHTHTHLRVSNGHVLSPKLHPNRHVMGIAELPLRELEQDRALPNSCCRKSTEVAKNRRCVIYKHTHDSYIQELTSIRESSRSFKTTVQRSIQPPSSLVVLAGSSFSTS